MNEIESLKNEVLVANREIVALFKQVALLREALMLSDCDPRDYAQIKEALEATK